jgi:hypothetical protein
LLRFEEYPLKVLNLQSTLFTIGKALSHYKTLFKNQTQYECFL